jgi:hypothetical protein
MTPTEKNLLTQIEPRYAGILNTRARSSQAERQQ